MPNQQLYKKYAKYYDKIYSKKRYDKEVDFIKSIILNNKIKEKKILDMACGTGNHATILSNDGFIITGVDINIEMLNIAKSKLKNTIFINDSMQTFKSKEKYNIIICLYTAINYNKNISDLTITLKNFYNNLKKGGIVIFDLGIIKGQEDKKIGIFVETYAENNLQLARIGNWKISQDNPDMFNANFLMLIKNKGKIDFEIDEHEFGIFSVQEIKSIMEEIGFEVKIYDNFKLSKYNNKSKRPVFVGKKQLQ